ncbi:ceramide-1-phosphate transfer protein [Polymixia lowei]
MKERAGLSPVQPLPQECPGQSFQTRRLLLYLQASLGANDDVLLEPYLHSWEELIKFMESLGTIVSFFSQKIKDKVAVIRELSLKHSRETDGKRGLSDLSGLQIPSSLGLQELQLQNGAYRSVGSMVEVELQMGVVDFYRRSQSGCRTLLRLHRSLQWLKLLLEGLAEGPNSAGQYRTPGELCREAYLTALAPHHPWLIRQAAELVFVSLPERALFLQLVCVGNQAEAKPILHTLADALSLVHTRTQRILEGNHMLELP